MRDPFIFPFDVNECHLKFYETCEIDRNRILSRSIRRDVDWTAFNLSYRLITCSLYLLCINRFDGRFICVGIRCLQSVIFRTKNRLIKSFLRGYFIVPCLLSTFRFIIKSLSVPHCVKIFISPFKNYLLLLLTEFKQFRPAYIYKLNHIRSEVGCLVSLFFLELGNAVPSKVVIILQL